MFERFDEIYTNRHDYAREWKKRTGEKIIGYFCTYAPEEIMYAANILPVRILGSHEAQSISITSPHIFAMYCPFCRDCLAQGLQGKYDYLDGVMIAQSCLHMRGAFNSWRIHVPTSFTYYLPMPMKVQSPAAKPYLREELALFKKSLEEWTGKPITDADLDRGIETVDKNRRLLRRVYEFRKKDTLALTGLEAMKTVISSQMSDKSEHNNLLKEVLKGLPKRKLDRGAGVRLMTLGSENDDIPFLEMLESLNATVVIEDHCTGSRYFWNEVVPEDDRLSAIAARYTERIPCAAKDWEERRRIPFILQLAKDYSVQGALLIQQKFCDPHELDIPAIKKSLESNGIPTYFLEFDISAPLGPSRIRMEAFIEQLTLELL
jgi:benzoyl-CoA reductase subunit C